MSNFKTLKFIHVGSPITDNKSEENLEPTFNLNLRNRLPLSSLNFIDELLHSHNRDSTLYVDNKFNKLVSYDANLGQLNPNIRYNKNCIPNIVSIKKLNDIRYINKFLKLVNEHLIDDGIFIGYVETSMQRWNKLSKNIPRLIKPGIYVVDYLFGRVWPKLPYLKKIYFGITQGKNRRISRIETIGRLYSCGFELLSERLINGHLYFAVRKVGTPLNCKNATYGPIISLNRTGKYGKAIKVYKIRTMYPYSEYLQEFIYTQYGLKEGGKLNNDIRVNELGRLLRKYFIDEFPMLFNLIRGDLKLFGVRPLSKHYLDLYPKEVQNYRNNFKPGLIPPFYVDMPKSLDEIISSEVNYLQSYEKNPFWTDIRYFFKALTNIFFKKARSQ